MERVKKCSASKVGKLCFWCQGHVANSAAGVSRHTVSCSRTWQQEPTQDQEPAGSRLVCLPLGAKYIACSCLHHLLIFYYCSNCHETLPFLSIHRLYTIILILNHIHGQKQFINGVKIYHSVSHEEKLPDWVSLRPMGCNVNCPGPARTIGVRLPNPIIFSPHFLSEQSADN